MPVLRSPRPIRLLGVLAAGFVVVACNSSASSENDPAAAAGAQASPSSAAGPSADTTDRLPSAQELDAQIKRALDPELPDSERTALIEDGEAFRDAIPDMYQAMRDHPHAIYEVTDPVFDNHDGTLTATMRLDKDGTGSNIRSTIVHFIRLDNQWKISRIDLCGILRSADYHTPACG